MPRYIQPSFARGEVSPALYGRVDTAMYQIALRTARNLVIHAYGGASNRPGLEWYAPVKDHDYAPLLIPFQYKTDDKYMLEFGDEYMRVMRNNAHVLETAVNITGATQANPVVVTANAHGYSAGQEVYVADVGGMTEINARRFLVANPTANTFELTDQVDGANINGTGFSAYTSGGTVARVFEIETPYAVADLERLKYEQDANTMTLTHPSYRPRELTRSGHTSWTLTEVSFEPEIDYPSGQTVTVNTAGSETHSYRVTAIADETNEESLPATSDTSTAITNITQANPAVVTATAHGVEDGEEVELGAVAGMTEVNGRRFIAANVTANTFELQGIDSTGFTAYSSGGTVRTTFVKVTTSASTTDNTIAWSAVTNAKRYAVYREFNGLYGLIGETESTSFEDDNITANLDIAPPSARDPFEDAGTYPGTASYYEQRRVLGGSTDNPDTSYFSRVGRPSNMSTAFPVQADDAITVTLNAREVNDIRHYVPGNDLLVFTSGAEWRINSGQSDSLTQETIKQKPQSYWGCSHLRPIVAGDVVLFLEASNRLVRSFGYELAKEKYVGEDLSLLAEHLFSAQGVSSWAYGRSPDPVVFMVMSDGSVATLTFQQKQEVIAWTHWDTSGKFERVATQKHTEDSPDDTTFFVVKRKINGRTVRYIEGTHSRRFDDVRDCFFVDCGASYDVPVTVTDVTEADPVVVTANGHGFSDGDEVDLFDIEWEPDEDDEGTLTQPEQLNGGRYTVANATANTFELSGVDGSAFNAYVEGGTVRKAVTTISGLNFLEGREVSILADGNVVLGLTVSGGSITLPRKASRIHVGLKYVADLETLNIEAPSGTIQGVYKHVPEVTVRFQKSRGLFIGPELGKLTEMRQREFEKLGEPTNLLTGDATITLNSQWDTDGRVFLRQQYPLPMTILAVIPKIFVGEDNE